VPPEDDNGNPTRSGQLERGRHRLRAAARYPGVVDNKDIGIHHGIANLDPVRVDPPSVRLPSRDRQPDQRKCDGRANDPGERMPARPPLTARHHRHRARPGGHPRRRPQLIRLSAQESSEHSPQPVRCRGRRRRVRPLRLVRAQVMGEPSTAYRVPDWHHHVREQLPDLAQRQFTLVTPGKPGPSRPPATSAHHSLNLGLPTDSAEPDESRGDGGPLAAARCGYRSTMFGQDG